LALGERRGRVPHGGGCFSSQDALPALGFFKRDIRFRYSFVPIMSVSGSWG